MDGGPRSALRRFPSNQSHIGLYRKQIQYSPVLTLCRSLCGLLVVLVLYSPSMVVSFSCQCYEISFVSFVHILPGLSLLMKTSGSIDKLRIQWLSGPWFTPQLIMSTLSMSNVVVRTIIFFY